MPGAKDDPPRDPLQRLGPSDHGRFVFTTRHGTRHLFDLGDGTVAYRRTHSGTGTGAGAFDRDGELIRLPRVDRWPEVASTFFIWFDEDGLTDAWRQSSTIISIEVAP